MVRDTHSITVNHSPMRKSKLHPKETMPAIRLNQNGGVKGVYCLISNN